MSQRELPDPWSPNVGRQDLRGALLRTASAHPRLSVKDRHDGRRDRAEVRRNDVAAGYIQALSVLENAGLVWREKRGQNVHYGLEEDALTGTLVHFLAEVCPRSRPFRKASAEAAKRKKQRKVEV